MDREITPDSVDKAMRFAMATMGLPTPVEPDRRDRIIAALRAVLAPLLDDPLLVEAEGVMRVCRVCGQHGLDDVRVDHAPGCAVLRRDELLGR